MDRLFARAGDRTTFAVYLDLPLQCLWVTVLIARQVPGPVEQVPGLAHRLAIPTGAPI